MPSESEGVDRRILDELTGRPGWKKLLLDNPDLFILNYFPDSIEQLKPFHLDLLDVSSRAKRGLILYPAQHGKTTLVSTLLPIWALCRDPNIRIAIIGKNETETEQIMRTIQAELTMNERLIEDFGPFRDKESDKPWALGVMQVAKRTRRHKSATIAVFGSGAKTVLGYRTDWTICDDVVTQENSATAEQRYKIKNWFNLSVATGPEPPRGRLTVVGTMFDPSDLYHDLLLLSDNEGKGLWETRKVDAIVDDDNCETLWPEKWPWALLMEKKLEVGTIAFNKRYRNIAVDESRMVFREEYVRGGYLGKEEYPGCLDTSFTLGDFDENWRRVAGFDPAIGAQRQAKFCAHITMALGSCRHHEKCLWFVDLVRDQMSLQQQVDAIIDQHQKYRLQTTWIEANSYQKGLYDAVQQRLAERGVALAMEPHYTTRVNKPDPEVGVQALAPWFERGWVHIPWADPHSRRKMQVLVDELVQYPSGRTTDTVMASWIAWRALDEHKPTWKASNYLRNKPMAWGTGSVAGRRTIRNPAYAREG